jgi:adenylosuccinate synthase
MINGVTELYVSKPDVMNDFETISMCTAYKIGDHTTDEIPYEYNTAPIEPVLTDYPGWRHSLLGITDYVDLPEKLKSYLDAIERETGVPVAAVSISPDRRDVLFKQK